jgi:hypothetical protein
VCGGLRADTWVRKNGHASQSSATLSLPRAADAWPFTQRCGKMGAMYKTISSFFLVVLLAAPGHAQSHGVVVPVPDSIARGLRVLGAVTGHDLLAALPGVTPIRFGAAGQLVLGGASSAFVFGEHHRLGAYRDNAMSLDLRLLTGRFVVRNVLLGFTGGYALQLFAQQSLPSVGHVGPLAGYNVRLHDYASLLPTFALTYDTWAMYGQPSVRHHAINLAIDVTFVMQLTQHLALSFAPFVKQSVYHGLQGNVPDSSTNTGFGKATWDTVYGLKAGVLGWF